VELFNLIFNSGVAQFLIFWAKIVSPIVFLFLLGVIIYCLVKSIYFNETVWRNVTEFLSRKSYGSGKAEKRWQTIAKRLENPNMAEWKLAVIEAENLADEVLGRMGYAGASFGERLKKVDASQLQSLDDLTAAHQTRNNIVHDPDYRLEIEEATRTLNSYERALRELDAI
jgi:hypothetical protein